MIVLDTHALVWLAGEPRRLSRPAAAAIRTALSEGGIGVAAISLWELAMLFVRGRLRAAGTVERSVQLILESTRVTVREVTPAVAAIAAGFPGDFPRDSADRLIAATAIAEGTTLVTRDEKIRASPLVKTVW